MLQCYCLHVTLYRAHVLRVPFWSVWGPQEVWKSFTLLQFLFVPSEDKKKMSLFLPSEQTRVRFIWESASPQSRPSSSGTARWWGGALSSRRRRNNLTPAGSEGDIYLYQDTETALSGGILLTNRLLQIRFPLLPLWKKTWYWNKQTKKAQI